MPHSNPVAGARLLTLWGLALALLASCFGCSPQSSQGAAPGLSPVSSLRSKDPRAVELRSLLERGERAGAAELLDATYASLGVEGPCLRARLSALENNLVSSLREIEGAKTLWPSEALPAATLAEIYAGQGRLTAAQEEIDRAVGLYGRGLELTRALGVLALATPGQAKLALALLEEVQRSDPELSFVRPGAVRARVLLTRGALGAGDVQAAANLLKVALEWAPKDQEVREAQAEVLVSARAFAEAADLYEALYSEGQPVLEALMSATRAAAAQALIDQDRGAQLKHYLRLRELGVSSSDLGFGASVLMREANDLVQRGSQLFERGEALIPDRAMSTEVIAELTQAQVREFELAEQHFRRALYYDPSSLEAHHRLGEVLFRLGSYAQAASSWEAVRLLAESEDQLGAAVHLNIARAHKLSGDAQRARRVLLDYLAEQPAGRWIAETQAMLDQL